MKSGIPDRAIGKSRTVRVNHAAPSRPVAPISVLAASLLTWFSRHARDLPWRRTADPYAIWVSEIMLQQTQVTTVIPYFERWMGELPTVASLAKASSQKIHKLWEGLGYYTRVRNLQSGARLVLEKHDGKFPTKFDDVLALPGIGRYTAGAVCSIAFNQPTPILDGNVIRVLTRLFGILDVTREKETAKLLWSLSERFVRAAAGMELCRPAKVLPTGPCSALNQSLMELGATICTPRCPECDRCPVAKWCVGRRKNLTERLPNLGKRAGATARQFAACVMKRDGAVLVRQRPAGVVNAHLWEFPNVEVPLGTPNDQKRTRIESELGCATETFVPLLTVRHTITRYRMTLEAFAATLNGATPRAEAGQWVAKRRLSRLPFTSAHRRILTATLGKPHRSP